MIRRTVLARLTVAVVFIFSTIVYQFRYTPYTLSPNLVVLYVLFFLIVMTNLIYLYLDRRGVSEKKNLYIQFSIDVMFITSLVFITGGSESPFLFLYILLIIVGSMFLYKRGGYYVAGVSTIFYGALLDLQYFDVLPVYVLFGETTLVTGVDLVYKLFLHTFAFLSTAFLSVRLSEQLRKATEELKRKRINVVEVERISRAIPSAIPSGVIVISKEGKVLYVNTTAESILGRSFSEIYMEDLDKVSAFDLSTGFRKEIKIDVNGAEKIIGYSILDMDEERKLLIFQDLTEIKEKEREMELNERFISLGRMMSVLAHEIRNPLEAIGGAAEFIKEKVKSPKVERMVGIIIKEVFRLDNLLREFIELTQINLTRRERVDLRKEVEDVLTLFKFQEEGCEIIFEAPSEDVSVTGDPEKIRECLINVIKNGIEAMEGKGTLEVEIVKDKDYVNVICTDRGVGIPEDALLKVFEPFFTTKHGGTGLGLSIVYRIMKLHEGKVEIKSKRGRGTTVILSFPV